MLSPQNICLSNWIRIRTYSPSPPLHSSISQCTLTHIPQLLLPFKANRNFNVKFQKGPLSTLNRNSEFSRSICLRRHIRWSAKLHWAKNKKGEGRTEKNDQQKEQERKRKKGEKKETKNFSPGASGTRN